MLCFVRHDFPSQVSHLICTLQNLQLAREKFSRDSRGKQRPIELSSRVRPLIASAEYDSEFRWGTPSHSIVSCFVRVEGRFAMSERDCGARSLRRLGGETRIYALRMAAIVDEGMHFQVIIIAVTKERGRGEREPRVGPRPSRGRRLFTVIVRPIDTMRAENYRHPV